MIINAVDVCENLTSHLTEDINSICVYLPLISGVLSNKMSR